MKFLSIVSFVAAIILFVYDAVSQWIASSQFKVRTAQEIWTDMSRPSYDAAKDFLHPYIAADIWNDFVNLPAPLAVGVIATIFLIISYIISVLPGGQIHRRRLIKKKSGAFQPRT